MNRKILWVLNAVYQKFRGLDLRLPGYIAPIMYINDRTKIKFGRNVRVWPGVRIECYRDAILTVEDNVSIGAYCHITIAEDLTIKKNSVFAGWNLITNINHSDTPRTTPVLERPWDISSVSLGENVYLGHGSKILPGAAVPPNSIVGTNAVVTKKFQGDSITIVGVPGKINCK